MRFKAYLVLVLLVGAAVALLALSLQRCSVLNSPNIALVVRRTPQGPTTRTPTVRSARSPTPGASGKTGVRAVATAKPSPGLTLSPKGALAAKIASAPPITRPVTASKGIEGLTLRLSRPLPIEARGARGLAADAEYLYLAITNASKRNATLYQLRADTLAVVQAKALQETGADGRPRYQVGGVQLAGTLLWLPLTGDAATGSALLALDRRTLAVTRRLDVDEHITAVAQVPDGRVFGVDASGTSFHAWAGDASRPQRTDINTGARYHDLEVMRGSLVCSGTDAQGGVLDVLDPNSLSLLVRHRCDARSSTGRWVTDGGFAYGGSEFLFVPDEGPLPMLYGYVLSRGTLDQYIPSTAR